MQVSLDIQVSLASQATSLQASLLSLPVPLKISIHNPAEAPVTLLTWNTPFDLNAGVLGVFEICDTGSGQTVPVDKIKVSRKLPATSEDLVEIPAGETVDRVVKLPIFQLEEGHQYSIQAQGVWHAVWDMALNDVTASQLADLTGAIRGEFQSNVVFVTVD